MSLDLVIGMYFLLMYFVRSIYILFQNICTYPRCTLLPMICNEPVCAVVLRLLSVPRCTKDQNYIIRSTNFNFLCIIRSHGTMGYSYVSWFSIYMH